MTERPSAFEVRTSYSLDLFPAYDDVLRALVGRGSDFSGAGGGVRDLGWCCDTEFEATRIKRALRGQNIKIEIRQREAKDD